jgi:hypothetical protein
VREEPQALAGGAVVALRDHQVAPASELGDGIGDGVVEATV